MGLRKLPEPHRLRQGKGVPQGNEDVTWRKGVVCQPRKSKRCLLNSDDDGVKKEKKVRSQGDLATDKFSVRNPKHAG